MPSVLQSMGSQRVRHDLAAEQQPMFCHCYQICFCKICRHLRFFPGPIILEFCCCFFLISVLYISTCLYLNFNFTPEMARPRKIEELALIKKYLTGT